MITTQTQGNQVKCLKKRGQVIMNVHVMIESHDQSMDEIDDEDKLP